MPASAAGSGPRCEFVTGDEERRFVEPRVLELLGLEDGHVGARRALRRLAPLLRAPGREGPFALVFEDLQWADAALVEFVGHLSGVGARQQPIFVLCLARPDLQGRHPEFGQGSHQTTLSLAPLSEPVDARAAGRIRARACRRSFASAFSRARKASRSTPSRPFACSSTAACSSSRTAPTALAGEVAELEVPETLQGLIAARLDGLAAEERRLLQDASVLGKTFTKEAAGRALGRRGERARSASGRPRAQGGARRAGRPALAGARSVRVPAGPRPPCRLRDARPPRPQDPAPRRGERSSRRASASAEQEIVEVVAAHYLAAYEAQPDADDAGEIKAKARELPCPSRRARRLARRGRRGAPLVRAAPRSSRTSRWSERSCSSGPSVHGARPTRSTSRPSERLRPGARAPRRRPASCTQRPASRDDSAIVEVAHRARRAGARDAWREAFAAVSADEPDADVADLASRLGRSLYAFAGELERAVEPTELALGVSQALRLPETLVARARERRRYLARGSRRPEEELALLRHAIRVRARERSRPGRPPPGTANLSDACFAGDRYGEALEALGEAARARAAYRGTPRASCSRSARRPTR